jgi:predicted dehydrogenase
MWAPQLDMTEALRIQAQHFVRCIEDKVPPITDGECGLRVVRILEAATQSLAERGRLVELDLSPLGAAASASNGHGGGYKA